ARYRQILWAEMSRMVGSRNAQRRARRSMSLGKYHVECGHAALPVAALPVAALPDRSAPPGPPRLRVVVPWFQEIVYPAVGPFWASKWDRIGGSSAFGGKDYRPLQVEFVGTASTSRAARQEYRYRFHPLIAPRRLSGLLRVRRALQGRDDKHGQNRSARTLTLSGLAYQFSTQATSIRRAATNPPCNPCSAQEMARRSTLSIASGAGATTRASWTRTPSPRAACTVGMTCSGR